MSITTPKQRGIQSWRSVKNVTINTPSNGVEKIDHLQNLRGFLDENGKHTSWSTRFKANNAGRVNCGFRSLYFQKKRDIGILWRTGASNVTKNGGEKNQKTPKQPRPRKKTPEAGHEMLTKSFSVLTTNSARVARHGYRLENLEFKPVHGTRYHTAAEYAKISPAKNSTACLPRRSNHYKKNTKFVFTI